MSRNQEKLDELRKILLSLLVARQDLTPITLLERDYYKEEQTRIPYRQFGFPDLLSFLQSMPEHFIIEQNNGLHYVRPIASDKSKHVSSLVARQKNNTKSRFLRRPPHMRSQRIKIGADKLFNLIQHVRSNPNGVSMQDALNYVCGLVPHINISPFELREQLREVSHLLYLDSNMIYPVWNNDILPNTTHNTAHRQPSMQQSSMPEPRNQSRIQSESRSSSIHTYAAGQEDSDWIEDFSDEGDFIPANCINNTSNCQRRPTTSEQLAANLAQYSKHEQTNTLTNKTNDNNNNDNMEINVDEYFALMNSKDNAMNINTTEHLSQIISDRTKLRLKQLLDKHPEGIWCAELPDLYLQEYKVRLNYTGLGFASVREFTSHLPQIFYMAQGNKTADFILYSADKKLTEPRISQMESTEILQASNKKYDEHSTMQYVNDDDKAPIPSDVSSTITKRFAPNDVMNYDDDVGKISVTELQNSKTYLEIYISEVFHPCFFWIHLRENKKRFDRLMIELCEFYDHNKDTYTIAKIALKKGLNCACLYSNKWHRGVIKNVKADFKVTIFFYDYGTLKTYAPEEIYYLHKRFSYLPAQAIPCGLYNVKPCVGDRWKRSVIEQFIDKVNDTLLAATIISVDPTADAVDMASIMKYVVNNFNQLPTYCFAEENLMPDNCCKATSIAETHEVPFTSPGSTTHVYCDSRQQQPVKPPPGFAPLGEQRAESVPRVYPPNVSTRSFHNDNSFANVSNMKTSTVEATNPFLTDQQFIPNDIAKQIFISVWNENMKLQIKLVDVFYNLLRMPLTKSLFNDHITIQFQLNKVLKVFEKMIEVSQDNDRSNIAKTPSTSANVANEMPLNDISMAQKALFNLNNETANQNITNTFLTSNPFGFMNGGDKLQNHTAFSTCGLDDFAFKTNWSQHNEHNSHIQMPSLATETLLSSMYTNHIPSANTFLPNVNQPGENVLSMKPVPPAVPTNTNIPNNFSEILENVNTQFSNMFKNTNPFKSPFDGIQTSESQNEQTAHDTNIASNLSARNPQGHVAKTEAANIYPRTNCFPPAEHINVNSSETYTPRIIYESGPVMYNTQKKQADADIKQSTCSTDSDNTKNVPKRECIKESFSQPANDITGSHMQHEGMINHKLTRDNSQIENYATQSSTYYVQDSQPTINGELNYQQNSNTNNLQPTLLQGLQVEISECWVNSGLQNNVSLSNPNENSIYTTPIALANQNWNRKNDRKSVPQETNRTIDSNYVSKFEDNHDKKKTMNAHANSWHNIENRYVEYKNMNYDTSTFIFQKIDTVKGVSFIFNIEQEGWILTNEFVEVFTNFKFYSHLLAMLEMMNINTVFKEIQRSEYPLQFLQLDRYPLNVPRDSKKRIISINLISLQTTLALLHKLRIVSREEIDNAFKKNEFREGSILPTLWVLIVTYRDLKQRIDLCSNYVNDI
ncbi:hypothetical protein P5V15_008252 [Pogonomyrmex californicus]